MATVRRGTLAAGAGPDYLGAFDNPPFKERTMNILANMETIFLVTLGVLGTGLMLL